MCKLESLHYVNVQLIRLGKSATLLLFFFVNLYYTIMQFEKLYILTYVIRLEKPASWLLLFLKLHYISVHIENSAVCDWAVCVVCKVCKLFAFSPAICFCNVCKCAVNTAFKVLRSAVCECAVYVACKVCKLISCFFFLHARSAFC